MSDKIIELDAHRPHTVIEIECVACKYELVLVAPVDVTSLGVCPACITQVETVV